MQNKERNQIIRQIRYLLDQLEIEEKEVEEPSGTINDTLPVFLTVKECTEMVPGIAQNTIRQLVKQNKISSIRAGETGRGKILINKSSLLKYFQNISD